jgi:hypothetical protein
MAVKRALYFAFAALLAASTGLHSKCSKKLFSSMSCIDEGDFGALNNSGLCTFCNLYTIGEQFFFYPRSGDQNLFGKERKMILPWKPAVPEFVKYNFTVQMASAAQQTRIAAAFQSGSALKEKKERKDDTFFDRTLFVIPKLRVINI